MHFHHRRGFDGRFQFAVLAIVLFLIAITGCSESQTEPGNEASDSGDTQVQNDISYPATNPDTYEVSDGWNLVWSDEFEGDDLNSGNWTRQILPEPFNDEWQQYFDHEENSYVEDGYLVLKAIHHSETHGKDQYTSARLHTGGKQAWKYGKIAARIQLPYGQGIWPAFWMLGADIDEIGGNTPWPFCGEIDILELYGSRNDALVEANIHYDDDGHKMMGAEGYELEEGIFAEKFHVFEIEWNEESITWLVDGKEYFTTDISQESRNEFHGDFYILLNIAVGGEWAGRPDETTPFPSLMYVDWVRVYQQN
ncbi:MAG: glycoside hydrolase family 16 protein [Planctomycetota bacterium]